MSSLFFKADDIKKSCFYCKHAATRVIDEIEYCTLYKKTMTNYRSNPQTCAKFDSREPGGWPLMFCDQCVNDTFTICKKYNQAGMHFKFICTKCGNEEQIDIDDPTYEG